MAWIQITWQTAFLNCGRQGVSSITALKYGFQDTSNKSTSVCVNLVLRLLFEILIRTHKKVNFTDHDRCFKMHIPYGPHGMAWRWAKTLVEIRGTLADIGRTTK